MGYEGYKINIGCGGMVIDGWQNIDRNPLAVPGVREGEARILEGFEPDTVEEIYASYLADEMTPAEFRQALERWKVVMKSGGVLVVRVPNCERQVAEKPEIVDMDVLPENIKFSEPTTPKRKKNFFSSKSLAKYLKAAGFKVLKVKIASHRDSVGESFAKFGRDEGLAVEGLKLCDIWCKAIKPTGEPDEEDRIIGTQEERCEVPCESAGEDCCNRVPED